MELRSQKRMRPSVDDGSRDRLSEMSDEVLVHILSCMPIVDAVRTILLRRFGNLWTLVPTLKLDMEEIFDQFSINHRDRGEDDEDDENDERFYIFIRNVLILHKRLPINKFHLCIEFLPSNERTKAIDEIKTWLRFALGRQAKEIKFCHEAYYDISSSLLPNFTSQSLVTLVLDGCKIETRLRVNLPSLKKLFLDHCFTPNEELQRFISGCPSLRELVIMEPSNMDKLSFSAPSVDKLSLVLCFKFQSRKPLLLDCPNLKTLDLSTCDPLDIIDISSVRDIYVKQFLHRRQSYDKRAMLRLFYWKIDCAEVIHLSGSVASWDFLDTVQHLNLEKYKLKRVVLELGTFCHVCLIGINHMMRRLRNLEELTIYTPKGFNVNTDLLPLEVPYPYVTPQLKTITLHGFNIKDTKSAKDTYS